MKKLLAAAFAVLFIAPAFASSDPVADTRQIMAGTVSTKSVKQAYLSGAKDGTTAFKGALTAYKGVRAAEPPLTVTCADGTAVNAPGACPMVMPPPQPVVTEPVVSQNGAKGDNDIADNFDVQSTLIPTVESVPASLDPAGAFRFTCLAGQLSKDDPIVYPGQPGKSHLHQFFGNTGTNAASTYQSLRTTGGSTCTRSTDVSGQRTAYWMPAMLDGAGNAVKPDFLLTYYKALPKSSPDCGAPDATHIGFCVPLPNGLRFIRGYNMANGQGGPASTDSSPGSDAWKMGFDCEVTDGSGVTYTGAQHTIADILATGKCPVGAWMRAYLTLPDCWDGKNLDTADHRSHMVYADGAGVNGRRACPADHPYNIPEIALQAFFRTDANFEAGKWHLSSDEMLPGFIVGPGSPVKAGTSLHFDYWEAWSPVVKNLWQTGCIDGHLSCNVGETGTGKSVKGMAQDFATIPNHGLVPLSSIP
jgi:hypothetical protein